ncbi:hypothetical protein [Pseudonocardia sp. ICBG1293]|uniref:hypothetical protein n=1 Tax=Pseudonocardia sp. ICBG1293 TaxID=2844382 RepID=UPI001CC984F5|nr:hypothetical protein [Pseudonocardia sp. ICBG1293]
MPATGTRLHQRAGQDRTQADGGADDGRFLATHRPERQGVLVEARPAVAGPGTVHHPDLQAQVDVDGVQSPAQFQDLPHEVEAVLAGAPVPLAALAVLGPDELPGGVRRAAVAAVGEQLVVEAGQARDRQARLVALGDQHRGVDRTELGPAQREQPHLDHGRRGGHPAPSVQLAGLDPVPEQVGHPVEDLVVGQEVGQCLAPRGVRVHRLRVQQVRHLLEHRAVLLRPDVQTRAQSAPEPLVGAPAARRFHGRPDRHLPALDIAADPQTDGRCRRRRREVDVHPGRCRGRRAVPGRHTPLTERVVDDRRLGAVGDPVQHPTAGQHPGLAAIGAQRDADAHLLPVPEGGGP